MPQNKTIARLLAGESDNHILPFFWQHGEPLPDRAVPEECDAS